MIGAQSLIIFSVFAFLWLNFAADMATYGKMIRIDRAEMWKSL